MSTVILGEDLGIETSADLKQKLAAVLTQDLSLIHISEPTRPY